MIPYPNFNAFHEQINKYLDHFPKPVRNISGDNSFFFELVYRSLQGKMKSQKQCDGIGDLDTLSLDLIQDFNVPYVCSATGHMANQINPEKFGYHIETERKLKEVGLDDLSTQGLILQGLQESAGLKLLDMYLPKKLADAFPPSTIKGEHDWKEGRCAFWRYLEFCGFVQIKDSGYMKGLEQDSIPRMPLLTKLAKRLMDEYDFQETYGQESLHECLRPEAMAENFLRFNDVKGKKLHKL